jgi:uncharacterized membrane protein YraQ (UPF0718 family)
MQIFARAIASHPHLLVADMNSLNNALTLFFSLLVEAMPFLLLGVLFSSLLLLFVDERKLIAAVPRNPILAAFAGSLIGCLFPVCECGNVPVARRLLMQGAPSGESDCILGNLDCLSRSTRIGVYARRLFLIDRHDYWLDF